MVQPAFPAPVVYEGRLEIRLELVDVGIRFMREGHLMSAEVDAHQFFGILPYDGPVLATRHYCFMFDTPLGPKSCSNKYQNDLKYFFSLHSRTDVANEFFGEGVFDEFFVLFARGQALNKTLVLL